MRLVVDQAHLAQKVASLQDCQEHLSPLVVAHHDPGTAIEQDEQGVALLALLNDRLTPPKTPLGYCIGNPTGLLIGQQRKERYAANEVQVRDHRHGRPFLSTTC